MHTVYLSVWSFVFVLGNVPCSQIEAKLKLVESSAFDISCVITSICMVTDRFLVSTQSKKHPKKAIRSMAA